MYRAFYDAHLGVKNETLAFEFWCAGWEAAREISRKLSLVNQIQENALRCAYADLKGSLEDFEKGGSDSFHDYRAHAQSIDDLARAFPKLKLED